MKYTKITKCKSSYNNDNTKSTVGQGTKNYNFLIDSPY